VNFWPTSEVCEESNETSRYDHGCLPFCDSIPGGTQIYSLNLYACFFPWKITYPSFYIFQPLQNDISKLDVSNLKCVPTPICRHSHSWRRNKLGQPDRLTSNAETPQGYEYVSTPQTALKVLCSSPFLLRFLASFFSVLIFGLCF